MAIPRPLPFPKGFVGPTRRILASAPIPELDYRFGSPVPGSQIEDGTVQQRDYILRMIEQVGAILVALRERILKRAVGTAEVHRELRRTLQQVGFDLDLARLADPPSLERMVAPTGELDPTRGWMVAEALYIDGLEAQLDGRDVDACRSLGKALRLFRLFDPRHLIPSGFPEAKERIDEIEERLRELGDGRPGS
jgi:hypothetical protein